MKGVILASGSGTRLYPITIVTNKQLLPIYDKPMIYYPLSTLMLAGIKDILIISSPNDLPRFKKLLGDGSKLGINLSYAKQQSPDGLAQALTIGKKFIGRDACALILGDNIFYGSGLVEKLKEAVRNATYHQKMTLFCYQVNDPKRFGVVELDRHNKPIGIEEKPKEPKSNFCVTGLYFYPPNVATKAAKVPLSKRGEYEITNLNNMYIEAKQAEAVFLGRGYSWLDAGTSESLADASNYIGMIQRHNGIVIAALEEIAYTKGWIDKAQLLKLGKKIRKTEYGKYLINVATGKIKGLYKENQ